MARPSDRMRLKDRIIDNISKAIKGIQEHLLYTPRSDSTGDGQKTRESSIVLSNGDRSCQKLCENLDHALLHGLKNVTHGYWRMVKQLTHKGLVKEIEFLTNVTTDLGRGRAWLYASLNEGLLESYIRVLGDNEKLVKKYYAKEALLLDGDRMNVLLTLTSGLDCASFRLDYDLPYLDLSAYPPRSLTDSEPQGDVYPSSYKGSRSGSVLSEMTVGSPDSTLTHATGDSDTTSLTNSDILSSDLYNHMKVSMTSADSGLPGESHGQWHGPRQRSVTPIDPAARGSTHSLSQRASTPTSVSSFGSEADRHQRIENILTSGQGGDEEDGDNIEVIHVKKKGKKKKTGLSKKSDSSSGLERRDSKTSQTEGNVGVSADGGCLKKRSGSGTSSVVHKDSLNSDSSGKDGKKSLQDSSNVSEQNDSNLGSENNDMGNYQTGSYLSKLPLADSGVDICGLSLSTISDTDRGQGDKSVVSQKHELEKHHTEHLDAVSKNNGVAEDIKSTNHTSHKTNSSAKHELSSGAKSALAEIESKIAEMCHIQEQTIRRSSVPSYLQTSEERKNHDLTQISQTSRQTTPSTDQLTTPHSNSAAASGPAQPNSSGDSIDGFNTKEKHSSTSQNSDAHKENSGKSKHKHKKRASDKTSKQPTGPSETTAEETDAQSKSSSAVTSQEEAVVSQEDDFDFYSSHGHSDSEGASSNEARISHKQGSSQLEDYMDYILKSSESSEMTAAATSDKDTKKDSPPSLALNLDNNTKLQVMLDIFTQEDESFIQIFVTRENHTEGESQPVFVLISDHYLYFLRYQRVKKKFVLHSKAKLADLIFISTGLNDQTLNIESRDSKKQKQRFWLTPGHEALTQAIQTSLTKAVTEATTHLGSPKSRFSVGTEVPLQKIALRKYISKEINCESQAVEINDYTLVFWEDPSSSKANSVDIVYMEGTLLLRTVDPFKGYVWKPVYVVLRNNMLCVSNHKSDPQPHSYLGLGGDQCVGCRLTAVGDRDSCLELVLATGGSWHLSAASEVEITQWRHALCLAVSQGKQDNNTLAVCVPCCAVLACSNLFLCHEDLQTRFCRTLGRARVEDVTAILVDEEDSTYCVVEFESTEVGVSTVQWVLYFMSSQDLNRHIAALGQAWREVYQVELPSYPLVDVALQKQCQNNSAKLKADLSLG